jgi:hypothetical protein
VKAHFLTINNPAFDIIETIKVENHAMVFREEHLQRMKLSRRHWIFISCRIGETASDSKRHYAYPTGKGRIL